LTLEVVKLVDIVIGKAVDVIEEQSGVSNQYQTTCNCVAEELIAEATEDVGVDFRV
jgi:hypothetical protein